MTAHHHLTVATIVQKDHKFLMVDEMAEGSRVINQPAGHVELNETVERAAVRETLEETGWHVELTGIVGAYLYKAKSNGVSYFRVCFVASAQQHAPESPLDQGIVRPVWMTLEELQDAKNLRSPLVLKCVQDFLAREHMDLSYLHSILSTESDH